MKGGDVLRVESFIKFPRGLVEMPEFSAVSVEAKLLFALILDRLGVSEKNSESFADKRGNIFVIYPLDEICGKLGCGPDKAVKTVRELEKYGLIKKRREGCGKPSRLFVTDSALSMLKIIDGNTEKTESELRKNRNQDFGKTEGSYNKENYNNISYNNSPTSYEELTERIEDQIEFDCIAGDEEIVREIICVMSDVMTGLSPTVKIGSEIFPREAVISRYNKLTAEHIQYVVNCIENAKTKIGNMKGYLVAALFNAPATMASADAADIAYYQHRKRSSK